VTAAYAGLLVVSVIAAALADLRWLRVAQREHYLPGSASRFALRWWLGPGPNRVLAGAAAVGTLLALAGLPEAGVVAAGAVAVGPFGLGLRGRTAKLAWTRRLRVLAAGTALLTLAPATIALVAGSVGWAAVLAMLTAIGAYGVVDTALAATAPLERRLTQPFVTRAEARLRSVAPDVVAVTGSYGKTSTKGYIAHLVSGTKSVVASPASFNNRAGLARAVNEHLAPGTQVFVAEMGTYGPGEIGELCAWIRPRIAVITAIGPVHLERMRSEERILQAKAEILDGVDVAVLNVDDGHLAALAQGLEKEVVRCSAVDRDADVCVTGDAVWCAGTRLGDRTGGALEVVATNLACAVAVALELGVPGDVVARRLVTLSGTSHRLSTTTGKSGVTILDDTYNANPAGTRVALATLARLAGDRARRVVVTPGMVELGTRQPELNEAFGREAAAVAGRLLVVGLTNRAALVRGATQAGAEVLAVEVRDDAVAWVREHLGPGDAVLYENDLPDHYP
jgi:UDP-N-acetylmuramoyl-tripeptide--D-alanyl-D-alanine ligase